MAARKQEAPDSREQACMLCRRAEADPDTCGRKVEKHGLCAHVFCLFFANELFQQELQDVGLMGFLPEDIRGTIEQAARKHCFVCGESGATITCQETGCDRSFHLPCAVEGGCVTQFFLQYRSFCCEHRPEQAVQAAPEENTACLICLDLVGDRKSYCTMVCPACKHAWFHRGCIQGQAVRAGISCFQCPLCRDREAFVSEMFTVGIRIPFRLPSWENSQAYAALSERHSRCDARECLCPGGREQAEEEGPWRLLLCCSCAAEGTHRGCSHLRNSTASWECDSCAGLGTGKRQSTRVPLGWGQGPGKACQRVPRVGLAEPLCFRGAGGTALAYPAPGLGGRALDLPASPYSLQRQLGARRPQHRQPVRIGAFPRLPGTRHQQPQHRQPGTIGVIPRLPGTQHEQLQHRQPGGIGAVSQISGT
ncbi:E3 ubiquitin-protein ligase PHF7-like [Calonectris borealis]|uniref:E3 ubiquitin-protein ligase PHF7-like n=1 Tax=Calonectris borealis TaxID=1323832 RepID=UPI003F4BF7CD